MGTVYLLTLRQLSGRWRLLIMTALAALPVLVALLTLRSANAPSVAEFEQVVFSAMLAGAIVPLVMLASATPAFAAEIEDRTLANLMLAAIPRWHIAVPKLLATITVAAPFVATSALVTAYIAFLGDRTAVAAATIASVVAVVLYAAAFVWLGLVSTHAVGLGLLYIVLWEGFFSGFVAGVRLLSIRHYATAVMHGIDPRRFAAATHPGLATALIVAVVLVTGFMLLTVRRLRRMDVP